MRDPTIRQPRRHFAASIPDETHRHQHIQGISMPTTVASIRPPARLLRHGFAFRRGTSACLLLATLLSGASAVEACTCLPPSTPADELERSESVFHGRVLQQTDGHHEEPRQVSFAVYQIWRGSLDPVQTLITASSVAACGFPFDTGHEYLVYSRDGTISSCSRSTPISQADEDLAALGTGRRPVTAQVGDVVRHALAAGSWLDPARPGEVFVVEVLEMGRGLVYWLTALPDDRSQQWLYGLGAFDGDTLHVPDLMQAGGGAFGDGAGAEAIEQRRWGALQLTLHSDGHGKARWSPDLPGQADGERELQRLTRPPRTSLELPGEAAGRR
jgi:hypothetical protein